MMVVASQDQNQATLPPVKIRLTHGTWHVGTKQGFTPLALVVQTLRTML